MPIQKLLGVVLNSAFCLILMNGAAWAETASVAGLWKGTISHGTDSFSPTWDFTVSFEQTGSRLSGNALLEARGQFARFALEGNNRGKSIHTTEGSILEENSSEISGDWCMNRKMDLALIDPNKIEGTWTSHSPGCTTGRVILSRERLPCNDPRIVKEFDANSPRYHSYGKSGEIETIACATITNRCNARLVFGAMLEEARFIAPTDDKAPVTDCKITRVTIGLSKDNEIRTVIDRKSLAVNNYTIEGRHTLHPGEVTRSVVERGGKIYIRTEGEGLGPYGWLNKFLSRTVWKGVDEKLLVRLGASTGKDSPRAPH